MGDDWQVTYCTTRKQYTSKATGQIASIYGDQQYIYYAYHTGDDTQYRNSIWPGTPSYLVLRCNMGLG